MVVTNRMKTTTVIGIFVLIFCAAVTRGEETTTTTTRQTPSTTTTTRQTPSTTTTTRQTPSTTPTTRGIQSTTEAARGGQSSTTIAARGGQSSTTTAARGGQSTTTSPLSPQTFLDLLQQGIIMSNNVMTLDEIFSIIPMVSTMNPSDVTMIIQDLNINISSSKLSGALVGLQSLTTWGTFVLPNGNLTDLFNMMSTLEDKNFMVMLKSLKLDKLDPLQLGEALAVLQYIHNSKASPNKNTTPSSQTVITTAPSQTAITTAPSQTAITTAAGQPAYTTAESHTTNTIPQTPTFDNLDDLLNMLSAMDEQSLKQFLQGLNIAPNIDPSQLGGALTILQNLQSSLSAGSSLLPNVDIEDLLNMMTAMDTSGLTLLLQGLNIDGLDLSKLGDAMTLLQSLQSVISDGNNITLPAPDLTEFDDLLNMITTIDEQSLMQLLKSLNIDAGIDPSQLGGALTLLQGLQSALSDGNPLLSNVDLNDLLTMLNSMDGSSLTLLLQSLNIDGLDPSKVGEAMILFQTLQNSMLNGNFQFFNGTEFDPLEYLDLTMLSDRCSSAMSALLTGVVQQEPWAFQMIDAWGKPESGILDGNVRWLGSYDQCMSVQPKVEENTPFEPNYCISGNKSAIMFGMCLPRSCTDVDINSITRSVLDVVPLSEPLTVDFVQCKKETEYDTKSVVATCVCSIFLALMTFATLYDVIIVSPKLRKTNKQPFESTENTVIKEAHDIPEISAVENEIKNDNSHKENNSSEISTLENNIEEDSSRCANGSAETSSVREEVEDDLSENMNAITEVATSESGARRQYVEIKFNTKTRQMETNSPPSRSIYTPNEDNVEAKPLPTSQFLGLCEKFLISFSVWTNGKRLLNTKPTSGTLGSINGIRFISMSWVILAYSFTSAIDHNMFVNKVSGVNKLLQRRSFMAVSNSSVSIDTFFAMSGLLVSYVFMKEMKREKGRINWFMFYFHRFWRLTPTYMLVLMMDVVLFRYISDGPIWQSDVIETDCKDKWWTNILYINNFVKVGQNCFSWSWYLACDMQFYIISPLLLVPLYFSKKIGRLVTTVFLFGVVAASGYISFAHELPTTQYSTEIIPNAEDYYEMYYIKPYCRMGPYIVGIVMGYILSGIKGKSKLKPIISLLIWTLMSAIACAVVFAPMKESSGSVMLVTVAALYNSVHRIVWGVCVSWVVYACVTGNGGFINTVLSWRPFVPLRRLTYCAYLVHPLITAAYYRSRRQQIYASDYNLTYLFFGHLILSYVAACVIFLAIQSPLMGLERAIVSKYRRKDK